MGRVGGQAKHSELGEKVKRAHTKNCELHDVVLVTHIADFPIHRARRGKGEVGVGAVFIRTFPLRRCDDGKEKGKKDDMKKRLEKNGCIQSVPASIYVTGFLPASRSSMTRSHLGPFPAHGCARNIITQIDGLNR